MPLIVADPPTEGEQLFPTLSLSRDGDELWLTRSNGWYVMRGIEGLDNPPVALVSDDPATWDGSLFRAAFYQSREVFIPAHLQAADNAELTAALRHVTSLLDPKRGPVTLTVAHPDGRRRSIEGYLSAPFGQALIAAEAMQWRKIGLRLRCMDPFFAGDTGSLQFSGDLTPDNFLGDPFLPVALSDSQVAGTVSVTNNGDADAYPVWTIVGPASSMTIDLGGRSFSLSGTLGAGETLTVDATRGAQSVTVGATLAWGRLQAGADLAPLPPGASTVDVEVTGATDATTVAATWSERWLTAW